MLQIRRILKLFTEECSIRELHRLTGIHRLTLKNYLHRFNGSGKSFAELASLTDHELALLVHPPRTTKGPDTRFDYLESRLEEFAKELSSKKNKHLSKQILWEEYLQDRPDGYQYSQFCHYLEQYLNRHDLTMVVPYHEPGDRLQIDFAGNPLWIVTPRTGERIACPVLVCTLPCSSFFYAEPLASARQEHLIPALNRALQYLGGVPRNILSDNMKQSVTKASRYEPIFNELMEQWALHYQTNLQATRIIKPKDKPSVEKSVHVAYQQIYSRLRNETFTSLNALKHRVHELLENVNDRLMSEYGESRRKRFQQLEQSLLHPLPSTIFAYKRQTIAKVKRNYHVILGEDRCQYSVPHEYVGKTAKLIYDESVVEVFYEFERIAIHQRILGHRGRYSPPVEQHMPESHRRYAEQKGWSEEDFIVKAATVGSCTEAVVLRLLTSKPYVEQSFDSCLGVLSLKRKYGAHRLEAACEVALQLPGASYRLVRNILENNRDQRSGSEELHAPVLPLHENIRGKELYR